jgi:DNA polymerase gamma 1
MCLLLCRRHRPRAPQGSRHGLYTPSHAVAIPHGESLDIQSLLAKGDAARLDPTITSTDPPAVEQYSAAYTPRTPVMTTLSSTDVMSPASIAYIHAQISSTDKELRDVLKPLYKPRAAPKPRSKMQKETPEAEYEEEEISHNVAHYQALAQMMPVENAWHKVYERAGNVGKKPSSNEGVWNQYQFHPRSTGPRTARA